MVSWEQHQRFHVHFLGKMPSYRWEAYRVIGGTRPLLILGPLESFKCVVDPLKIVTVILLLSEIAYHHIAVPVCRLTACGLGLIYLFDPQDGVGLCTQEMLTKLPGWVYPGSISCIR